MSANAQRTKISGTVSKDFNNIQHVNTAASPRHGGSKYEVMYMCVPRDYDRSGIVILISMQNLKFCSLSVEGGLFSSCLHKGYIH